MEDRKFIKLYSTLSEREKEAFHAFVSLLHDVKSQHIAIASALRKVTVFSIENLQSALKDGNIHIDAHRFEKLFNPLKGFLEDFIVLNLGGEELNDIERYLIMIEYLDKHKLFSHLESVKKKAGLLHKDIQLSREYYAMYRLERMIEILDKRNKGAGLDQRLTNYESLLEQSYLIEKIRIEIEKPNRSNVIITKSKNEELDLQCFIKYLPNNLLIRIYYYIYFAIKNQTIGIEEFENLIDDYSRLKNRVFSYDDNISIGHFLINICIVGIRKGRRAFYSKLLKVVEIMESKNVLLERGTIEGDLFKMIVTLSSKTDLKWSNRFYEKYSKKLVVYNGEDINAYCKSLLLFEEKNFDASYNELMNITTTNYNEYMKLNLKKQTIKCLVELNWGNWIGNVVLDTALENMKKMIQRTQKLSEHQEKQYKNFVKYNMKLLSPLDKNQVDRYLVEIEELEYIQERDWVLSVFKRKLKE